MTEKPASVQIRPRIVTLVAVIDFITGIGILLVFLLFASAALQMPLQPQNNVFLSRCFGIVLILVGLWGGGITILTAWNFYNLKPTAYQAIRAAAWRPQFALVTRFGKRLDDEDVRAAFGLPPKIK